MPRKNIRHTLRNVVNPAPTSVPSGKLRCLNGINSEATVHQGWITNYECILAAAQDPRATEMPILHATLIKSNPLVFILLITTNYRPML